MLSWIFSVIDFLTLPGQSINISTIMIDIYPLGSDVVINPFNIAMTTLLGLTMHAFRNFDHDFQHHIS